MDQQETKQQEPLPSGTDTDFSVAPRRAATVGTALAEGLRRHAVDVLVIWDDPDSAVLAHVVAVALDCEIVRAVEIEGLVEMVDSPPAEARAAILAPIFPTDARLHALESLVRRTAGSIVVVAAAQDSAPLQAAAAAGRDVVLPREAGAPAEISS